MRPAHAVFIRLWRHPVAAVLLYSLAFATALVAAGGARDAALAPWIFWLIMGPAVLGVTANSFETVMRLCAIHQRCRMPAHPRAFVHALMLQALIATVPALLGSVTLGGSAWQMASVALALLGWATVWQWMVVGALAFGSGLAIVHLIYARFGLQLFDLLLSISPTLWLLGFFVPGAWLFWRGAVRLVQASPTPGVDAGFVQTGPIDEPTSALVAPDVSGSASAPHGLARVLGQRQLKLQRRWVLPLIAAGMVLNFLVPRAFGWPPGAVPAVLGMASALLAMMALVEVLDAFSRRPAEARLLGLLPQTPRDWRLISVMAQRYAALASIAPQIALPLILGSLVISAQPVSAMVLELFAVLGMMLGCFALCGVWLLLALVWRMRSRTALGLFLLWFTAVVFLRFSLQVNGFAPLLWFSATITALPLLGLLRLGRLRLRVHELAGLR